MIKKGVWPLMKHSQEGMQDHALLEKTSTKPTKTYQLGF